MTDDLAVPLSPDDPAIAGDQLRDSDPVTPTVDRPAATEGAGPTSGGEAHRPGVQVDAGSEAAVAHAQGLPADPPRSAGEEVS